MGLDRFLHATAAGLPVAIWLFLAAVVLVSVTMSFAFIARPSAAFRREREAGRYSAGA